MTRQKLIEKVVEAIKTNGNKANIVQVSKYIWDNYEQDLRKGGDIFYTWPLALHKVVSLSKKEYSENEFSR
jgi:hypothetical protein